MRRILALVLLLAAALNAAAPTVGDLARAAQLHQEQADIYQRVGERSGRANALLNLGYDYLCLGLYEEGRLVLEQSLKLFEKFGARREMTQRNLSARGSPPVLLRRRVW